MPERPLSIVLGVRSALLTRAFQTHTLSTKTMCTVLAELGKHRCDCMWLCLSGKNVGTPLFRGRWFALAVHKDFAIASVQAGFGECCVGSLN
jgi:hypothetical protein